MVQIRISWSQILSRQQNTREIEFSTSLQVNFIFSSICLDRNLQVQSDKIFNYTDSFGLEAKKKNLFQPVAAGECIFLRQYLAPYIWRGKQ